MTTTRSVTATADGTAQLDIEITGGTVEIIAEPGRTRAEATITNHTTDPDADAMVDNATVQANGANITIRTATPPAVVSGGHFGRGAVFNNGGVVIAGSSNVVIGGMVAGNIHVNGVVVAGGGIVCGANARIEVRALVPEGSSANVRTQGGDVTTRGRLTRVDAHTNGGRTTIEHATDVDVHANGGSVDLHHFTRHALIKANGGSVRAFGVEDAVLDVTANGGTVVHGRNLDSRVTANGGSVRTEKR